MAEVLVEFNTVVRGDDSSRYTPRACTRLGDDGLWEGWIEFIRADKPGEPIRTERETEQHDRSGALYWARGLTQVYLEGALKRALGPTPSVARPTQVAAEPLFEGPRPTSGSVAAAAGHRAVLNPLEVYQQGEDILASELSALRAPRLRDIAVEYGLASVDEADAATAPQLAARIIAGVKRPAAASRGEQQPPNPRP